MHTRSSAALRIARLLDGPWPLFYPLILVPKVLRDWAYRQFAARRYRWFGKLDACRVPTPELRARFLD
jgi:predicted DCC family thiol-disulfide oxidoreductase YuxK